jgi:hypothetical protein
MEVDLKRRVLGVVGVIFGGGIILARLLGSTDLSTSPSYRSGQIAGLIFGIIFFGIGIYYLLKNTAVQNKTGFLTEPLSFQ